MTVANLRNILRVNKWKSNSICHQKFARFKARARRSHKEGRRMIRKSVRLLAFQYKLKLHNKILKFSNKLTKSLM